MANRKTALAAAATTAATLPAPAATLPAPAAPVCPMGVMPAAGWPAYNNANGWLALMLQNMPAIAAAKAHKYKAGAGLVPCANVLYGLTAFGHATAVNGGKGKSGKPTVLALMCVAHALAQNATQSNVVCGAAVAYFAYALHVLGLLQTATKTGKYIGTNAQGHNVPCPAWLSGYISGAARGIGYFNAATNGATPIAHNAAPMGLPA